MNIVPDMGSSAITTPSVPSPSRKVSLQAFLEKYSQREDGHKYEFDNGTVIKTKTAMSELQAHLAHNLQLFFFSLLLNGKLEGSLQIEMDAQITPHRLRRPDLCYLNSAQVYEASKGGHPVPKFVIEVISPNDTADYYDTKLDHYYAAGVQVVWFIYPKTEKVVVYGPDRSSVTLQGITMLRRPCTARLCAARIRYFQKTRKTGRGVGWGNWGAWPDLTKIPV
ncbi:MAG: Uma2 family endonuclease [Saprospiraceae bacterium]|nr:Uma2 family endonuclease [Saprospiraceae bacterium]